MWAMLAGVNRPLPVKNHLVDVVSMGGKALTSGSRLDARRCVRVLGFEGQNKRETHSTRQLTRCSDAPVARTAGTQRTNATASVEA